ncbi:hypothetical protein D3C84_1023160 [compost metagenome]
MDEIGRQEDSEAIMEAVNAGVQLFVTVHGYERDDLFKRPSLRSMLELGLFDRFIELSRSHGPGTVRQIKDSGGQTLLPKTRVNSV